jgi:hypothetical protein
MDVTQLIAMTKLALEQQATINAKQAEIAAKLDTLIALTNAVLNEAAITLGADIAQALREAEAEDRAKAS